MSHTFYILERTWQNAEMGQQTLRHMIDRTYDAAFARLLQRQLHEYRSISRSVRRKMALAGVDPRPIGCMQRCMTAMAMRCNLLIDRTPSHMAEMLMQGNAMGIIDAQKSLRAYPRAAQSAVQLAERLLEVECKAFDELSVFL